MPWKEKISVCFGASDMEFARHDTERRNAKEVLCEVLNSGVGFSEYKEEAERWLKSKGLTEDHIARQMARVSDLESYFQCD